MKRNLKWFKYGMIFVFLILLGLCLVYGSIYLKNATLNQIKKGFAENNCSFSSIHVSLYDRSVQVNDFAWQSTDTVHSNSIRLKSVQLKGIQLLELILNNNIYAKTFLLDNGQLNYNQYSKQDSTVSKLPILSIIRIDEIVIHKVSFEVKTGTLVTSQGMLDLTFDSFKFDPSENFLLTIKNTFNHLKGTLSKFMATNATDFYTIKAEQLKFDQLDQSVTVQDFQLIPNYGKYEFAQKAQEQVDRIKLDIPLIQLEGFVMKNLFDKQLIIHKATFTDAKLYSFRDKRIPPNKSKIIAMPMELLAQLPFALEIDSTVVKNAHFTIEDFDIKATRPGYVIFDHVDAALINLSSQYDDNKPKYAQLDARGQVMGNGLITASFRFPLDGTSMYSAVGKVKDLPLNVLNSLFENSARIKIESGHLNELYFNFNYTDYQSKGIIEINYEDLKVSSLNLTGKKPINLIKTTLIQLFLKKTKDETMARRKRVGNIAEDRDRNRVFFNFWWTSIQSGLKSCFLDKYRSKEKKK